MQIMKRDQKKKRLTPAIIHFLSILVLSTIIIVTPSLSFESRTNSNMTLTMTTAQHNIVKLLADIVRNKLHNAVNLLEITSKDPVIQNMTFANFITKKYMGIPANIDVQKRRIAQDILARDNDIRNICFLTPNADIYFGEPFSDQQQLPKLNYADIVRKIFTLLRSIIVIPHCNTKFCNTCGSIATQEASFNVDGDITAIERYCGTCAKNVSAGN